jgi:hypothetical protein
MQIQNTVTSCKPHTASNTNTDASKYSSKPLGPGNINETGNPDESEFPVNL